jgi:hypothetical protein
LGCCRMRGLLFLRWLSAGLSRATLLTAEAGLPVHLWCDGCDRRRGGPVNSIIVPEVLQRAEGMRCHCAGGWP